MGAVENDGGFGALWCGARLEYFTFVMATGIVSTALRHTGSSLLSLILLWIAVVGCVVLALGAIARHAVRRDLLAECGDRGFRVLAVVAAGGVLAARFAEMGYRTAALTLMMVSVVLWVVLQYAVLAALVRRVSVVGRSRLDAVDGTWFLWVVSTQSVAVASGGYAHAFGVEGFATLAVLCWGIGTLQLVVVACLVAARLLLVGLRPGDETAPYWVFMGSGAITILAAAEILGTGEEQLVMPRTVVGAVAMAIWGFCTWLVPLIVAMMLWQRSRPGAVRGYRSALWAMVFPIGMYGESSRQLGLVRGTGWLEELGKWESWIAFAVWLAVLLGMVWAQAGRFSVLRRRLPLSGSSG